MSDSLRIPLGCDWSANNIISVISHFLFHAISVPILLESVDRAEFFCPSPACVRQSSARARPEPNSHSNILSEPDPSPTESMSQLFILMTHLRTFFMNSLPLLNSGINRY